MCKLLRNGTYLLYFPMKRQRKGGLLMIGMRTCHKKEGSVLRSPNEQKGVARANRLVFTGKASDVAVSHSRSSLRPSRLIGNLPSFLRHSLIKKVKWRRGDLGRPSVGWLRLWLPSFPSSACTIHQSANGSNTCGLILPSASPSVSLSPPSLLAIAILL